MKRDGIWTWAAEMDAQEAFVQMEDRASGSGLHLMELIVRLVTLLQEFPLMAPVWRPPLRKALLRMGKVHLDFKKVVVRLSQPPAWLTGILQEVTEVTENLELA